MPERSPVPARPPRAAAAVVHVAVSVDLLLYMTSLTAVQHGCHSPRAPVAAREATNMCHVLTRVTKEHMVRCIPFIRWVAGCGTVCAMVLSLYSCGVRTCWLGMTHALRCRSR